jgi:hypothetical protein
MCEASHPPDLNSIGNMWNRVDGFIKERNENSNLSPRKAIIL